MHESQVHDLYDYEPQPYLLGFQNEERIKRNGLKKTDFDFKSLIGVSMFGHISMAKHKMSGTFVAIKCLSKKEIMRLKQVDSIYLEKEVLTFLNHPMIIRGGGSFQDASTLYLDEDKASAFLEMKQEEDAKLVEKQQEKETDGFRD